MKKRFIALLLCCVMLLTLSPSLISAASATDINGTTQSTEGQVTIGENTDTSSTETSTGSQPDATPSNPADANTPSNTTDTSAGAENGGSSEAKSGKDPASMTDAELYAYVKKLSTDEEIEAFLKQLPEERVNALIAYAQAQEPTVVPETVVFTDAGPFMPPVNVAMKKKLMRMTLSGATEEPADNGLELSKTAVANNDGTYTIRMEAYTTGEVIHTTKTVPVDIVLVLDQSGSMSYDFNGNSTNTNSARRQYAMKRAVNNFIDEVAKKYTPDADHRMAIVTFGSKASTLQGWTYVNPTIVDPDDTTGKTTLQTAISGLPDSPSGATNVAAGMAQAETLMGTGYSYTGTNTQRQKVVIVFTDGVPTTGTDFDTTVATSAIASAKNLKDAGATVYTIGIFSSADPTQLHGDKFDRAWPFSDDDCNGNVGEYWGYTNVCAWFGSGEEAIRGLDIAATNRFLNFLSSNFKEATNIGIEEYSSGLLGGQAWRITENFTRTASSYYLTANDSTSLSDIFQTISNNIQTANIDLGSETEIKDTVSPYFDAPADASGINLYTAAAKADGTFEERVAATGLTPKIVGNAVTVTGFNFNDNFVSKTEKPNGGGYGKKLIIEFDVTPKDSFIGGNDVPTNDWQNTGVYDKSGAEVEKFADATTTPTVNVPIKTPEFTANNKTIYEGNSTDVSGLYTLPDTTGWQYDYVKVTAGANDVAGETVSPTDCTNYTVKVTYAPKTEGTQSKGTPNAMTGKSTEQTATVHVLKPTVTATVNDVQKYYGESYTLGDDANGSVTVIWEDKTEGHTDIPEVEGTAPYVSENLSLTYSATGFNGTVPKHDFDVTVKVMNGNTEITGAVITTTCNVTDSGCTTSDTDGKYTVHVKTCSLTITKTGGNANEPYVFDVFKDGVKYSEVTVWGNGTEKLFELPVGTYTIQEDTGWSWRYSANDGGSAELTAQNPTGSITCVNTKNNHQWLNGFSQVVRNIFGSSN